MLMCMFGFVLVIGRTAGGSQSLLATSNFHLLGGPSHLQLLLSSCCTHRSEHKRQVCLDAVMLPWKWLARNHVESLYC